MEAGEFIAPELAYKNPSHPRVPRSETGKLSNSTGHLLVEHENERKLPGLYRAKAVKVWKSFCARQSLKPDRVGVLVRRTKAA